MHSGEIQKATADKILIGQGAAELIHIGQAILVLEGTLKYYLQTVFNYSTLARAYKVAALDAWNRLNS
jgi:NAD(P) transhydrogenase